MPPADKASVPPPDGMCFFFSLIDDIIFSLILLCSDLASCVALRRTNKADGHSGVTPALILGRIDASLAAEGMTGLLDVSRQPSSIPLPDGLSYFDYLVRSAYLLDVTKGWKRWTKGIYIARNKRMISGSNSLPVLMCPSSLHLAFPYKRAMSNMPHAIEQFAAFGGQLGTDQDGTLGLTRLRRRQYRIGDKAIAFNAKDPVIRTSVTPNEYSGDFYHVYPSFSGYITQRITASTSAAGGLAQGQVNEDGGRKLLNEPVENKTVVECTRMEGDLHPPMVYQERYIVLAGDKAEDTYAAVLHVLEGSMAVLIDPAPPILLDLFSFETPVSRAQGGYGRHPQCWAAAQRLTDSMGVDFDGLGLEQWFDDDIENE
ncbi:unnamed protein product [Vitrella brassicaformis CCMP3155]|uniref:Uncharacterized protein n=1 Tax=Vitrella brassicaformis (strain CCMP3155) TaxID=1169540 RepID=A0A0G4F1A8_VITBC|nr:unnamed protein product [Vitrella brassicaformis CCMP3155]|eukprot:CEM05496.1 unnamed protein product [Vitrella brassicaformis CCMP3155]